MRDDDETVDIMTGRHLLGVFLGEALMVLCVGCEPERPGLGLSIREVSALLV